MKHKIIKNTRDFIFKNKIVEIKYEKSSIAIIIGILALFIIVVIKTIIG